MEIGDLSFEMRTWGTAAWPATAHRLGQGHTFGVAPNYSARQMSHAGCRPVTSGMNKANVCEDWSVVVHSPGDDAATVDIIDGASGSSVVEEMRATGARFADPRRGAKTFSCLLAFSGTDTATAENPQHQLKVNGRFWEQLAVPASVLRQHRSLTFLVLDNVAGRQSKLFPRSTGAMPVSPYLDFSTTQSPI